MFFIPISRWAIAPVLQLLDIRREPGLSPFGFQFVSLEDSYRCATRLLLVEPALVLKEFRQHASAFRCENAAGDIALMIEPRVR